ncbi:sensor histidine kinase [Clostridium vincentii]|uniref:histidine kinase n=1 Tax=Clostridium vincentii TaxID=52704 RepID=A0A2T0BG10_9CLOT|nr:HAMP domain-containing sensor histidine kinase [Clostridium vincentii]PRR82804.1 putative sensor histidine kinase TcrY [Clostridium vincentii]
MNKLRKKFKIKSLQWQLILGFFVILVILLSIMGISQYKNLKKYLYTSRVESLQVKFHSINMDEFLQEELNNTESNSISVLNGLSDRDTSVAFIDKNGQVEYKFQTQEENKVKKQYSQDLDEYKEKDKLVSSIPEFSQDEYIEILNEKGNLEKEYEIIDDEEDNCQLIVWRKVGDMNSPSGLIQISTPVNDIGSILNKQVSISIIGSIMVLGIGLILGKAIFKRTLTPLYNITSTVEEINIEDLDIRLSEENGQLEIDRLAKSFNTMLERIEISFKDEQYIKEKMRRFVSDASHELRTPLTSIHGFIEVLLRGAAKNKDQLNLALNSMLSESERLTRLVNDLLLITKLEQEPIVETNREDLKTVIQEIVPQLRILAENREIRIDLKDNIMVYINKDQIKQVIFNLIQNAVSHTDKKDGIIAISTSMENTSAQLKISDNGTGIDEKNISKIYDRFFRSDFHRGRGAGGYGLGLSIVKSIIDSNSAKIDVESELGVGTTFFIYFKLNK